MLALGMLSCFADFGDIYHNFIKPYFGTVREVAQDANTASFQIRPEERKEATIDFKGNGNVTVILPDGYNVQSEWLTRLAIEYQIHGPLLSNLFYNALGESNAQPNEFPKKLEECAAKFYRQQLEIRLLSLKSRNPREEEVRQMGLKALKGGNTDKVEKLLATLSRPVPPGSLRITVVSRETAR